MGLGLPDDGYDYLQHLRACGGPGRVEGLPEAADTPGTDNDAAGALLHLEPALGVRCRSWHAQVCMRFDFTALALEEAVWRVKLLKQTHCVLLTLKLLFSQTGFAQREIV